MKYLTPLNNLCYLLHKKIEPYNDSARNIICLIENIINLWGNESSVKYDETGMNWIDIFTWQEFENDINLFSDYFLQLQFESINDHYDTKFDKNVINKTNIYDLVEINYTQRDRDVYLMGIRPIFRVILVNLIQNAIEALPLYRITENKINNNINYFEKTIIDIYLEQNEYKTILRLTNDTIPLDKNTLDKLCDHLIKICNKKISRKDNGNGSSLIEAAFYFTNIVHVLYNPETKILMEQEHGKLKMNHEENKMIIEITMPFGLKLVNKFLNSKSRFQNENERVIFKWKELYGGGKIS